MPFFSPQRPDRGRFQKRPARSAFSRTRELYYSLFTVLMVKIILFVFLWILFGSSVGVMRTSFKNISDAWRLALPGAIAVIALIIGYHIYRNIKEIQRCTRELSEARKASFRK